MKKCTLKLIITDDNKLETTISESDFTLYELLKHLIYIQYDTINQLYKQDNTERAYETLHNL